MAEYDAIIMGCGHNGLVTACYLAKAGLKVIGIEGYRKAGGGTMTEEVTLPGFKHDLHSLTHTLINAGPIIKDLELTTKFGLKYIKPRIPWSTIFEDKTSLTSYYDLDKSCKAIERFSKKDANAFREIWNNHWIPLKKIITTLLYNPPLTLAEISEILGNTQEGKEFFRFFLTSPYDVLKEWYESEHVRTHIMGMIIQADAWPNDFGGGLFVYYWGANMLDPDYGIRMAEGGSGELGEALARCLEAHGGKIVLNSKVRELIMDGDRASGVILDNGERIMAKKIVISNIEPQSLFLNIVGEDKLNESFIKLVKNYRWGFATFMTHYALNDKIIYDCENSEEVCNSWGIEIPPTMENLKRVALQCDLGEITTVPNLFIGNQSIDDPTRAPAGKHTLYLGNVCEPSFLKDGKSWEDVAEEVADRQFNELCKYSSNLKSIVLKRYIDHPGKMGIRDPNMRFGDIFVGRMSIDQSMVNRPFPGYSNYKTPIKGLYMSGPFCHPGGGVSGAPGYNCAKIVYKDLNIKWPYELTL
jgi:phytoene dehydrogenase-like protein